MLMILVLLLSYRVTNYWTGLTPMGSNFQHLWYYGSLFSFVSHTVWYWVDIVDVDVWLL